MAIATMTKNVIVWKPLASTAPLVLGEHAYWVTDVAFRDEKTLASSGLDNMVRLWNLNSGRETLSFMLPAEANSLAWGPGGVLALGCDDRACALWEPDSGRLGMAIADHPDRVWQWPGATAGNLPVPTWRARYASGPQAASGEAPSRIAAGSTGRRGPANRLPRAGGRVACLASGTRAPATTWSVLGFRDQIAALAWRRRRPAGSRRRCRRDDLDGNRSRCHLREGILSSVA